MPDIRSEIAEDSLSIFDNLNKFKVSLLHEETNAIWKKYFVRCYAPWLKHGVYAVTNVGIEIWMYIQTFILVRKAFFLEQTQIIQFHHKKINKHSKTGILMKLTKKPGNYCQ